MRNLVFAITLILGSNVYAQNGFEKTDVFVRVYNLNGKKISKGKLFSSDKSTLTLKRNKKITTISIDSIGSIKTKRSAGNNVLLGAAIGATTMAILGAATADPDAFLGYTSGEGAGSGALVGGAAGAAIGGITILFKNSKSYEISGDKVKWKAFKETILNN